jgi:stage II sporulation protein R
VFFMKKSVCMVEIGLLLLLALVFSAATGLERQQQRISDSMIRLHVVANSDAPADQDIKLKVRDAVLAEAQTLLQDASDREDAMVRLKTELPALEETANTTLRQLGTSDSAVVTLKRELFGTRYYDTFTLPGGYYEALRVTIGEGDGKNWWCVVYPQLCMSAATEPDAVPAMGSLSKSDTELLEDGEIRFRFRCLELLENLLGYFRDRGEGIPTSE